MQIILVDENIQQRELLLKQIKSFENIDDIKSVSCIEEIADLNDIDLIIFDVNSKNLQNVFVQIEKLKNQKQDLKFIATSYEINSNLVSETLSKGVDDFLLKPLLPNVLEASIKKNITKENKKAKTICIFSNKGGIGKTSTAINLAYEIQKETNKKVCILDLSFNSEDVALFLNIEQKYDLDYIVSNVAHYDEKNILSLVGKYSDIDLYVLEAKEEIMPELKYTPEKVGKIINVLKNIFDYLIIDTSSLINEFNVSVLNNSGLILLISNTNLNSLKNSLKCYELFDKIGYNDDKIKLILNRYLENSETSLQDIENDINKKVFSIIPNNYLTLIDAMNIGKCVGETNPQSNVAKAYKRLAQEILKINFEDLDTEDNYNHGIFNLLNKMGE